ncbi:MAG: integrase core domain-containing protein [Actinomycetota bacterium]|nr:integrase core domain-containing protein [Actinomycetota bacterium]
MFLAFVIDVFSRMILGWQLATRMRSDLVLDALGMALRTRQPGADFTLVAHTDQGSLYTAEDYTQVLDDHRVLASVGSVRDCYDNAPSESFAVSYKTELISDRVWRTNAQLELQTVNYVGWFNHRRLHSSIGNRPPVEHERKYWTRVALGYEPLLAQAAPTITDLRDVLTVASPMSRSEQ